MISIKNYCEVGYNLNTIRITIQKLKIDKIQSYLRCSDGYDILAYLT